MQEMQRLRKWKATNNIRRQTNQLQRRNGVSLIGKGILSPIKVIKPEDFKPMSEKQISQPLPKSPIRMMVDSEVGGNARSTLKVPPMIQQRYVTPIKKVRKSKPTPQASVSPLEELRDRTIKV